MAAIFIALWREHSRKNGVEILFPFLSFDWVDANTKDSFNI